MELHLAFTNPVVPQWRFSVMALHLRVFTLISARSRFSAGSLLGLQAFASIRDSLSRIKKKPLIAPT
jgi:hypothetical protein